jgi:hypothetical protein
MGWRGCLSYPSKAFWSVVWSSMSCDLVIMDPSNIMFLNVRGLNGAGRHVVVRNLLSLPE